MKAREVFRVLRDRIEPPFVFLTVIQYPAYGVVIGLANVQRKLLVSGAALALLHSLAVIAAFAFANQYFSGRFH